LPNVYSQLIARVFLDNRKPGSTEVAFSREEFAKIAKKLGIPLPKNIGDTIYSFRYRNELPEEILKTAPKGYQWIIEGTGRAKYKFKLTKINRIVPRSELVAIKVPDATPEIIAAYALNDEQALLAKVRYNRLVDIFLGLTAYSLQNHLRTTVSSLGQIEIDEVYVGIGKSGSQFIIPVQAKGGNDQLSAVQAKQDIACCKEKFPNLICRPVSAQFMEEDVIAIFELTIEKDEVKIVEERHYKLVPADAISAEELTTYRKRG
jgi:hypothetical protein